MRNEIVRSVMDQRRLSYTSMRIQNSLEAGQQPGAESSIIKVAGSDIKQRRWALEMKIAGPLSLGWEGDAFSDAHLKRTREWLRSRANSIEGGTSEIQLNIIAKRVLGLPSGKR
jgi:alkylation response protein AidB-like acyl-CoA dehydrogenase